MSSPRERSSRSTSQSDDQEPDVQDFCAPCGEIDFGRDSGVQCDPAVVEAESFQQCRMNCENYLNEARMPKGPRTRARNEENCRCLCKSLKLRNCNGKSACFLMQTVR